MNKNYLKIFFLPVFLLVLSFFAMPSGAEAVGFIYTSSDGGATWTEQTDAGELDWASVTLSSNGAKVGAVVAGGSIFTALGEADEEEVEEEIASSGGGSKSGSRRSSDDKVTLAGDSVITTPAGTVAVTSPSASTFTRNLTIGSTGPDVLALQKFLNAKGFTLALAGPGSPGNETSMFGALTRAALAKYQAAHGIAPAAGYFGPITMAYILSH